MCQLVGVSVYVFCNSHLRYLHKCVCAHTAICTVGISVFDRKAHVNGCFVARCPLVDNTTGSGEYEFDLTFFAHNQRWLQVHFLLLLLSLWMVLLMVKSIRKKRTRFSPVQHLKS